MKQLSIIFTFLFLSLTGFCDTLDYWHVYLNDELIAEFNTTSKNLTIHLKKSELKKSDSITVRYGSDHPCFDCYYGLSVFVEIMEKTPEAETTEHFGKLSISINDLLEIEKKYTIKRFYFNYYERTKKEFDNEKGSLIFTLSLT
jgi:hypothetical protein